MDKQEMVANGISAFLGAPLIALYALTILMFESNSPSLFLFIVSSFFGCFFQIAMIYLMKSRGIIRDMYASDRQTRTKPFAASLVGYLVGIVVLSFFYAPRILILLLACYFVNSFVMMMISMVWKISVHASGITGPATFLVHRLGISMLPFFVLILPVAWARIRLRAHDQYQVIVGAFLTILLTVIQLEFYLILDGVLDFW